MPKNSLRLLTQPSAEPKTDEAPKGGNMCPRKLTHALQRKLLNQRIRFSYYLVNRPGCGYDVVSSPRLAGYFHTKSIDLNTCTNIFVVLIKIKGLAYRILK